MAIKLMGLGDVTVASAGTPVPLSASQIISPGCSIRAKATNTGNVYVGGTNLSSSTRAAELGPGDAIEIVGPQIGGTEEELDLAQIYVDAANSGDKVTVAYFTRRE